MSLFEGKDSVKVGARRPTGQGIHRILTEATYNERGYIESREPPSEFKKHDYVPDVHEVGAVSEEVELQID
ncbi:hypothetical protein [Paenibacillus sp. JJ1722]|uniref:hypothetical protein n=1 Tax=Paenibacillus sp. JJ1722 TaxID=3398770 RepID=UPI003AB0961A